MAESNDNGIVNVVHPICCGLDVHKEKVSACLISSSVFGGTYTEVQEFGTFTDELMRLRDWLLKNERTLGIEIREPLVVERGAGWLGAGSWRCVAGGIRWE